MILRCCGTTHYMHCSSVTIQPRLQIMPVRNSYSSKPDVYNYCDFIFRTLSYYVIVKTYRDILITSLVSAPAVLPIHCIFLELVDSSLVRFIPAHAALIGTANLAVLVTNFVYSFHYDGC